MVPMWLSVPAFVIAVPGLTPISPTMVLTPVLVTVEPASTAKSSAEPRDGAVAAPDE
jgi:hypothetical protein